jgi:hypothetical protein
MVGTAAAQSPVAPAAADFTETEDNHLLSALVLHPVAPRLSLVGLAGWRRDVVLGLSHRVAAGGGIALHLLQQPHLNVMVSPVFVGGSEARTHTTYGEAVADAGVIQTLALKLNERVTLEQSFKANVDTSALDDHTVRIDASLTSQIVRRVNVNLTCRWSGTPSSRPDWTTCRRRPASPCS